MVIMRQMIHARLTGMQGPLDVCGITFCAARYFTS